MDIRLNIPEPPVPHYECRMTQKARLAHGWMCASKPVALRGERLWGAESTEEAN